MASFDDTETVEVTVRSTIGLDEVVINVPPWSTLYDCKTVLAEQYKQCADILEKGSPFVKFMPDGKEMPLGDKLKLGSRRVLVLQGVSLAEVVEEEEQIVSIDDFDEYDPNAIINSPRSLQACDAQGIKPQELIYAPIESFEPPGLPRRIDEMRHDFFEALRQDAIRDVRQARYLLIDEEEMDAQQGEIGQAAFFSAGSTWSAAAGSSASFGTWGSQSSSASFGGSMAGLGGIWAGPLEQAAYPAVRMFFDAMHGHTKDPRGGKLCEGSLHLPHEESRPARMSYASKPWKAPDGRADRYLPPVPKPFEDITPGNEVRKLHGSAFDEAEKDSRIRQPRRHPLYGPLSPEQEAKRQEDRLEKQRLLLDRKEHLHENVRAGAEKVQVAAGDLKRLPFGKDGGEHVRGCILRTESVAVVQRRRDSMRLDSLQKESRWSLKCKVSTAEHAKELTEKQHLEELGKRRLIDEKHAKNRGEWANGCQEVNFQKAAKRGDHWNAMRETIVAKALDAEKERNRVTKEITNRELNRSKRTAHIRDLQKISYARRWLDRRSRYAQNVKEVTATAANFQREILEKHAAANARIEEQKLRTVKWVEVVRELKALRKDFQDIVAERELRRQNYRRTAIAHGLRQMADDAEAAATAVALDSECTEDKAEESTRTMALTGTSRTREVLKSEVVGSGTMASTQSTNLPMTRASLSLTLTSPSASSTASPSRRSKFHGVPRFDFPRMATDLMSTPTAALTHGSASSYGSTSLSHNASAPALVAY